LLEIWHATPLDFELQLGKPLLKLINTPSNLNIAVRCETIDVHTTLIYIEIRGVENNSMTLLEIVHATPLDFKLQL